MNPTHLLGRTTKKTPLVRQSVKFHQMTLVPIESMPWAWCTPLSNTPWNLLPDSHNRSQPTCRGTSLFSPSAHHRWHMNPLSTNTRCHISSIFCAINKFCRVCLPTRPFCLLTQPEWPSFACHGPPLFGI
ncbi:hypothetical protein CEXT_810241 [Caerostris extrusa]|uniref:Uncharacterized protein n=1 Tax=Caerostris extrusa TaxID=172846 RepID=A0AAV4UD19_CAEEX|nr:hypothetical protein CEXT_810241 [Caerostris extrusa]